MQKQAIGCVRAATDILGDKWTPELLRFLANQEVMRFSGVQDAVSGINPRTLSARLARLEQEGVIEKITKNGSSRCEYCLTAKGQALIPILHAMDTWSRQFKS